MDEEKDLTGYIADKIKYILTWYKKQVIIIAAVIAVIVIAVVAALSGKPQPPVFENAPAAAFPEDKFYTFNKDNIFITMRVSDIQKVNGETGEGFTSTAYSKGYDKSNKRKVYVDLIIENKSGKQLYISTEENGGIYLGYDYDADFKLNSDNDSDNYMCKLELCDTDGEEKWDYTLTVNKGEKKEIRAVMEMYAEFINKINSLYLCDEYEESDPENELDVSGIGKPFMTFRFRNETFFPTMILTDDEEEQPPEETTAAAKSTSAIVYKYPVQTLSASSNTMWAINRAAKGSFEFYADIRAQGSAQSLAEVSESGYSYSMMNDSYVGVIPEISYDKDKEFEHITVYFKIDSSLVKNTSGAYTGISDEFKGIKRFNVFWYDEDMNMALPIETFHDESKNLVYADFDRPGTFALADMELWYEMLGITPEDAAG